MKVFFVFVLLGITLAQTEIARRVPQSLRHSQQRFSDCEQDCMVCHFVPSNSSLLLIFRTTFTAL